MRLCLALACSVAITVACSSGSSSGGTNPIHASDYDQHCAVDSDCIAVSDGNVCGCSSCGNTTINRVDEQRYDADYERLRRTCPALALPCLAIQCAARLAVCQTGTCVLCSGMACNQSDGGTDAHDAQPE